MVRMIAALALIAASAAPAAAEPAPLGQSLDAVEPVAALAAARPMPRPEALAPATLRPAPRPEGLVRAGGQDAGGWELAVGRIDVGGRAHCTGTLIGPDLVLTAAHCLHARGGGAIAPGRMSFHAGLAGGRSAASRGVRAALASEGYRARGQRSRPGVGGDVALLRLDAPIGGGAARPVPLGATARAGETVAVLSYVANRGPSARAQGGCGVLEVGRGTVIMGGCPTAHGASGAPIVRMGAGGPAVVAVMAAKAKAAGRPVSLGADVDGEMGALMARMDRAAPPALAVASARP